MGMDAVWRHGGVTSAAYCGDVHALTEGVIHRPLMFVSALMMSVRGNAVGNGSNAWSIRRLPIRQDAASISQFLMQLQGC